MRIEEEIVQRKFISEEQKLFINILYTSNWLNTRQINFFKTYDISPQQFNILRILKGQAGKPGNLSLLKSRMIDKEVNVSRLVDKLAVAGLLIRETNLDDKRQVDLSLSEKGAKLIDDIDIYLQTEQKILNRISTKEMIQMNDMLDRIRG